MMMMKLKKNTTALLVIIFFVMTLTMALISSLDNAYATKIEAPMAFICLDFSSINLFLETFF